jgi:hypothetical protein
MRLVFFSGLTYAEIPGFRPLLLDLHVPDDTTVGAGAAGIPVVVWIHGGGFTSGVRWYLPPTLEPDAVFAALTGKRGGPRSAPTSRPPSASCAVGPGSTGSMPAGWPPGANRLAATWHSWPG